jgi:Rrf2 family protein
MLDLSLHYDEGPILIGDISDRQNIPLKYLQQILVSLKLAGFLQSRKGPGGGYTLARSPKEITLGEVVRAMDGPIAPISCVSVTNFAECGCPHPDTCSLRTTFKEVRDAMAEVLDHTSFAEIADKQRSADGSGVEVFDYVI